MSTPSQDVPASAKQGKPLRQQRKQDPAKEAAQLHADIDRTREQLSQTVEALAHEADVPGQMKAKAHEVTETVQGKAEEVTTQAKRVADHAVAALPPTVRDQVERAIAAARRLPVPTAIIAVLVVLVLRRLLRRRSEVGS